MVGSSQLHREPGRGQADRRQLTGDRGRASIDPIPDAVVTLTAYQGTCGGTPVQILPSPAEDTTDAQGRFTIGVYPQETVADACIRLAYSSALYMDAAGVTLDPTGPPDTLRLDLVGP